MVKNMGLADRLIRSALAVVVAVLFIAGQINGIAALILGAFALIFIVTSLLGFCPLYVPFKFKTKK